MANLKAVALAASGCSASAWLIVHRISETGTARHMTVAAAGAVLGLTLTGLMLLQVSRKRV